MERYEINLKPSIHQLEDTTNGAIYGRSRETDDGISEKESTRIQW